MQQIALLAGAIIVGLLWSSSELDAAKDLQPGQTFRDCDMCPEMVVIPAGSFRMGSPSSEKGRYDNEGPVHGVTIPAPFAMGKYEVTFDEWDACVAGRWCKGYRPKDRGWGRGRRPVINVSWGNAKQYVTWLSRRTGKRYRLPSEAEWEYAARAGTTTARFWGEDADAACGYANVHDRTSKSANNFPWEQHNCDDGYGQTSPVGSFRPNGFGLHDVLGNVYEWVEDCWHKSYSGAPEDGSAWTSGGECNMRVLRGGSWSYWPRILRSADRNWDGTDLRDNNNGFRVARTLP